MNVIELQHSKSEVIGMLLRSIKRKVFVHKQKIPISSFPLRYEVLTTGYRIFLGVCYVKLLVILQINL